MKPIRSTVSVLMYALLVSVAASADDTKGASIVFAAAPPVSTSLVASVTQRVGTIFSAHISCRPVALKAGADPAAAAKSVDALRKVGELQIVVFVSMESCSNSIAWASDKAAAVNIAPLRKDLPAGAEGEKLFVQRVEREAARAVGGMLAMPTCPLHKCTLSQHKSLEGLDKKGRGLCPPCMLRASVRVRLHGLAKEKSATP